ncbi:hypothetical protein [Acinetobacter phage XC1]|nr:hypothetical protein [Acinetobacter phage XC1]
MIENGSIWKIEINEDGYCISDVKFYKDGVELKHLEESDFNEDGSINVVYNFGEEND